MYLVRLVSWCEWSSSNQPDPQPRNKKAMGKNNCGFETNQCGSLSFSSLEVHLKCFILFILNMGLLHCMLTFWAMLLITVWKFWSKCSICRAREEEERKLNRFGLRSVLSITVSLPFLLSEPFNFIVCLFHPCGLFDW